MLASKENARKAMRKLQTVLRDGLPDAEDEVRFVEDFLEAATRKLPSDAAYRSRVKSVQ